MAGTSPPPPTLRERKGGMLFGPCVLPPNTTAPLWCHPGCSGARCGPHRPHPGGSGGCRFEFRTDSQCFAPLYPPPRPNVPLTNNYSFFVLRSLFSYLSFYGYFFHIIFCLIWRDCTFCVFCIFPFPMFRLRGKKKLWGNAHEITLLRPNFTFFTWHKCQ